MHGRAGAFVLGGKRPVEDGAVGGSDGLDVFGRLHAPLYLERRHARLHERRHQVDGAQVLWGQQVVAGRRERLVQRAVAQLVRKPARLGAQAAVGRTTSDQRRHETLARIAHAQRAVRERLHFQALLLGRTHEGGHLGQRELARERHAPGAQAGGGPHAGGVMDVHLRGHVQARLGQGARQLARHADVLHDERVGSRAIGLARALERLVRLAGKHGRVERDVHAHAAQMRVGGRLLQVANREVVGAAARVERLEPDVHRVGSCAHRRPQRRRVARRRQKFHFMHKPCAPFLKCFPFVVSW